MNLTHLSEALRMFRRSRYVRKHGFRKYSGTEEEIANQIINSSWNKKEKYFQVSAGHFSEFYCRDFGMCAEALIALGHRDKVIKTLDYALGKFKKHSRFTTSISPDGKCFNFPSYGADSLPFIIHALRVAKADSLVRKYRSVIESEILYYRDAVYDRKTSLVRQDCHFSSIKDYYKRCSSCYDNCMLFMLAADLDTLRLKNPFPAEKIRKAILATFWSGKFFYEDISAKNIITGDANTFPFWCGVTNSKQVFDICIKSIEKTGLTNPFPLKYSSKSKKTSSSTWNEFIAGDYERDSVWIHLGLCFLDVVTRFDSAKSGKYIAQYSALIRKYCNFLEVYDRNGFPFRTPFYVTDESMLWVSKYLALKEK
jgi:hypothetical protein